MNDISGREQIAVTRRIEGLVKLTPSTQLLFFLPFRFSFFKCSTTTSSEWLSFSKRKTWDVFVPLVCVHRCLYNIHCCWNSAQEGTGNQPAVSFTGDSRGVFLLRWEHCPAWVILFFFRWSCLRHKLWQCAGRSGTRFCLHRHTKRYKKLWLSLGALMAIGTGEVCRKNRTCIWEYCFQACL